MKKLADDLDGLEKQRSTVLALISEKDLSLLGQGSVNSGALIRVLQAPALPPQAAWPLPVPVLGACGLVGLLGGLGFALLAERRQPSPAAEPTCYEPEGVNLAPRRAV